MDFKTRASWQWRTRRTTHLTFLYSDNTVIHSVDDDEEQVYVGSHRFTVDAPEEFIHFMDVTHPGTRRS